MKSGSTSVIIPCYNGEPFLSEALKSLAAQTLLPLEIIIVDDGSDEAVQPPKWWDGPSLKIIRQANGGLAAARNRALSEAKGEYVAFLDADDYWHPDKIAEQEMALMLNRNAVACYTRCVQIPGFFGFGPYPPPDVSDDEFIAVLWYTSFFPPSAVAARRKDVEAVGRFREGMGNGEDVELWMRLLTRGRIIQVPKELCYYRQHAGQFTNNIIKKVLGGKDARKIILQQHAERLVQAGIRKDKLWDPYRNDILMVYYRRDFHAARKLLSDYLQMFPFDFEMWYRKIITILPASLITSIRGKIGSKPNSHHSSINNSLGWKLLVNDIYQ